MVESAGRKLLTLIVEQNGDPERTQKPFRVTVWRGERFAGQRRGYVMFHFNTRLVQPDGKVWRRVWTPDSVDGYDARAWGWITLPASSPHASKDCNGRHILPAVVELDASGSGATYLKLVLDGEEYELRGAN